MFPNSDAGKRAASAFANKYKNYPACFAAMAGKEGEAAQTRDEAQAALVGCSRPGQSVLLGKQQE